jgi:hypothetical protein
MRTSDDDREKRRKQAQTLYELAMAFREEDREVFVYDEKHDLFSASRRMGASPSLGNGPT